MWHIHINVEQDYPLFFNAFDRFGYNKVTKFQTEPCQETLVSVNQTVSKNVVTKTMLTAPLKQIEIRPTKSNFG